MYVCMLLVYIVATIPPKLRCLTFLRDLSASYDDWRSSYIIDDIMANWWRYWFYKVVQLVLTVLDGLSYIFSVL